MAIAAPLLPFLPLVAKQILLNNFLSDVPSMAISTDRVDAERVDAPAALGHQAGPPLHDRLRAGQLHLRPPDLRRAAPACSMPVRPHSRRRGSWCRCSPSSASCSSCARAGPRGAAGRARCCCGRRSQPRCSPSPCRSLGPWSTLFGFVPLSTLEMGTVVGIVAAYLAATEATKRWFFRAQRPDSRLTRRRASAAARLIAARAGTMGRMPVGG